MSGYRTTEVVKNKYKVLVHYRSTPSPLKIAKAVIDDWNQSERPRIRLVEGKSLIDATYSRLRDVLRFKEDNEIVAVRFCTSNSSNADSVELQFTSPKWNYARPMNSCVIHLAARGVLSGQSGYEQESLVRLLKTLVSAGNIESAVIDSTEVLYDDEIDQAERRRATSQAGETFPSLVYWLTLVPASARKKIDSCRHNLRILCDLGRNGLIVSVGDRIPVSDATHLTNLVKTNVQLGLI